MEILTLMLLLRMMVNCNIVFLEAVVNGNSIKYLESLNLIRQPKISPNVIFIQFDMMVALEIQTRFPFLIFLSRLHISSSFQVSPSSEVCFKPCYVSCV